MSGQIHAMITRLLQIRTEGRPNQMATEKIKLIMKGIDPDKYNPNSPDDPSVIARLSTIAKDMEIDIHV